ncbi:hypothetical protein INS49_008862 [Diaporthe citri]|uniref:uncharacterized protein n=1 Tax=Diaporthe citri TaxID=83186 RepID=UPI001C7ED213|nr:uncharacterized protein INS49_008862 [Diaporthe citri]KAG6363759.1 hypothetical protein INS49_008862 [Diaporthe citri]
MAEPMDRPTSPWAERFLVSQSYPWKEENKSGLHPKFPDIDVKYPDTLSPEARIYLRLGTGLPLPSDPELDRLFLDENYQQYDLSGYFTWQALIFDTLQQTQPMDMSVDETYWLPLFAKKRWYNLDRPLTDGWRGTLDSRLAANATFSVDEPVFWEKLSPAIELADRLMRATVYHPFLDAILGVKATDYYPNNMQAEGLESPPVLAKNNTPPRLSQQELLDTLERYAEKIVITFMSPTMSGNSLGSSLGITTSLPDPHLRGANNGVDFALLMLNPVFIWRLLDPNESVSSKMQATFILAITMAHEMVHAIYRVRNMFVPAAEVLQDEPFYAPPGTRPEDSAWISELGVSWEQSMINGSVVERPIDRDSIGGLFMLSGDVPNNGVAQAYGRGIDLASHENERWHAYALPAFVAQAYGSDEFWQTHVVKYGLPALYFPKLFRTELDLYDAGDPAICQLEYALKEFHPKLQEYAERANTRQNQWSLLRPWIVDKGKEWHNSVYSQRWLRDRAVRFRVAHRQGDEWVGQQCFRNLGATTKWGDVFTTNGYLLDQDEDWTDQAIGYLMMVIMPIRPTRFRRRIPYFTQDEHSPSAAAAADAAARNARPFELKLAGVEEDCDESDLEARNISFAPNDPNNLMGTRASLMAILKDEIPNRQKLHPVPDPVYQALKAMFDNVDREEPRYQVKDKWLSNQIAFVLPPWQTEQAKKNVGYSPSSQYVPYNPSAQPQQHVPGAAQPPQQGPASGPGPRTPDSSSSSSSSQSSPYPTVSRLGTPAGEGSPDSARSSRGRVARRAGGAAKGLDEVYYTVGEVGDHLSSGDLWIIADDGVHGYVVYDATDVIEEMRVGDNVTFTLNDHCERTLLGLKALPHLQRNLEEQAEPLGKLILPMRRHEIAERDGRHGKPLWISVGNDVFDISNFPFEDDKQRNLMTKVPGGNPWKAVVKDGTIDYDQLNIDLQPYRCAVVASQVPDKGPGPAHEFHFTLQEVACHVYPETTMYAIIRGQVYNLTGYMDFHPGGRTILRQWAGRDSTQEFERFHADADRCLADFDYLRVGRVVAEKAMDQLTHNEVALNGYVYDLGRIGNGEPERQFIMELDSRRLRGKDMTSVLNDGFMLPPESLKLLPERPDLITAKLAVPLREIDLATLRANNGSHMTLPEGMKVPRNRVEADLQMPLWVAYDDRDGRAHQRRRLY